jgi:hypothetical protein
MRRYLVDKDYQDNDEKSVNHVGNDVQMIKEGDMDGWHGGSA